MRRESGDGFLSVGGPTCSGTQLSRKRAVGAPMTAPWPYQEPTLSVCRVPSYSGVRVAPRTRPDVPVRRWLVFGEMAKPSKAGDPVDCVTYVTFPHCRWCFGSNKCWGPQHTSTLGRAMSQFGNPSEVAKEGAPSPDAALRPSSNLIRLHHRVRRTCEEACDLDLGIFSRPLVFKNPFAHSSRRQA